MDISKLFGKTFEGPYGTTIHVHGEYSDTVIFGFEDGVVQTETFNMVFPRVKLDLHAYPYVPYYVSVADMEGYVTIGIWKSDRDFKKDAPSLVTFCSVNDDHLEDLIAEDFDTALRDYDLYALVIRS